MKFSICIPNYNYEKYLGRTLASVLAQSYGELEIAIADNASTDRSVEIAQSIDDDRIRVRVNRCNVGFAGNLDRAARLASGDRLVMLSSDDIMRPEALAVYRELLDHPEVGAASRTVVTSTMAVIDPDDQEIGELSPDPDIWRAEDRSTSLSALVGADVYRIAAPELLGRSLRRMRNPFNFAATTYDRELYESIEGYGGGRLINPDKWFHWRLLGVAETALFVDRPLFANRWHPGNQTAQQEGTRALKHLADEYASTLEIGPDLLQRANLDREAFERAFLQYDIVRHGLATLARGGRAKARRILRYGQATYPWHLHRIPGSWALRGLLSLGPIGQGIARLAYASRTEENNAW